MGKPVGNHQVQRKTKSPCAKYHSAAHDSALPSFMEGTDGVRFTQTKGIFPFYTIAWKGSLQKDEQKKEDRASC